MSKIRLIKHINAELQRALQILRDSAKEDLIESDLRTAIEDANQFIPVPKKEKGDDGEQEAKENLLELADQALERIRHSLENPVPVQSPQNLGGKLWEGAKKIVRVDDASKRRKRLEELQQEIERSRECVQTFRKLRDSLQHLKLNIEDRRYWTEEQWVDWDLQALFREVERLIEQLDSMQFDSSAEETLGKNLGEKKKSKKLGGKSKAKKTAEVEIGKWSVEFRAYIHGERQPSDEAAEVKIDGGDSPDEAMDLLDSEATALEASVTDKKESSTVFKSEYLNPFLKVRRVLAELLPATIYLAENQDGIETPALRTKVKTYRSNEDESFKSQEIGRVLLNGKSLDERSITDEGRARKAFVDFTGEDSSSTTPFADYLLTHAASACDDITALGYDSVWEEGSCAIHGKVLESGDYFNWQRSRNGTIFTDVTLTCSSMSVESAEQKLHTVKEFENADLELTEKGEAKCDESSESEGSSQLHPAEYLVSRDIYQLRGIGGKRRFLQIEKDCEDTGEDSSQLAKLKSAASGAKSALAQVAQRLTKKSSNSGSSGDEAPETPIATKLEPPEKKKRLKLNFPKFRRRRRHGAETDTSASAAEYSESEFSAGSGSESSTSSSEVRLSDPLPIATIFARIELRQRVDEVQQTSPIRPVITHLKVCSFHRDIAMSRAAQLDSGVKVLCRRSESEEMNEADGKLRKIITIGKIRKKLDRPTNGISKAESVQQFLARHPNLDINRIDGNGETYLHLAVAKGDEDVVAILLANRADPTIQDHLGNTPLHIAAKKCNQAIVDLLLQAEADTRLANKEGQTPLYLVTIADAKDEKIVSKESVAIVAESGAETPKESPKQQRQWIIEQLLKKAVAMSGDNAAELVAVRQDITDLLFGGKSYGRAFGMQKKDNYTLDAVFVTALIQYPQLFDAEACHSDGQPLLTYLLEHVDDTAQPVVDTVVKHKSFNPNAFDDQKPLVIKLRDLAHDDPSAKQDESAADAEQSGEATRAQQLMTVAQQLVERDDFDPNVKYRGLPLPIVLLQDALSKGFEPKLLKQELELIEQIITHKEFFPNAQSKDDQWLVISLLNLTLEHYEKLEPDLAQQLFGLITKVIACEQFQPNQIIETPREAKQDIRKYGDLPLLLYFRLHLRDRIKRYDTRVKTLDGADSLAQQREKLSQQATLLRTFEQEVTQQIVHHGNFNPNENGNTLKTNGDNLLTFLMLEHVSLSSADARLEIKSDGDADESHTDDRVEDELLLSVLGHPKSERRLLAATIEQLHDKEESGLCERGALWQFLSLLNNRRSDDLQGALYYTAGFMIDQLQDRKTSAGQKNYAAFIVRLNKWNSQHRRPDFVRHLQPVLKHIARDHNSVDSLTTAIEAGNHEAVGALISHGLDINNVKYEHTLVKAAQLGNRGVMHELFLSSKITFETIARVLHALFEDARREEGQETQPSVSVSEQVLQRSTQIFLRTERGEAAVIGQAYSSLNEQFMDSSQISFIAPLSVLLGEMKAKRTVKQKFARLCLLGRTDHHELTPAQQRLALRILSRERIRPVAWDELIPDYDEALINAFAALNEKERQLRKQANLDAANIVKKLSEILLVECRIYCFHRATSYKQFRRDHNKIYGDAVKDLRAVTYESYFRRRQLPANILLGLLFVGVFTALIVVALPACDASIPGLVNMELWAQLLSIIGVLSLVIYPLILVAHKAFTSEHQYLFFSKSVQGDVDQVERYAKEMMRATKAERSAERIADEADEYDADQGLSSDGDSDSRLSA